MIVSHPFLLRMGNAADKICMENQNTRFMFSNFFSENRAGYEIQFKNIVESDRLQVTTWRIHTACWLPKAKTTHWDYVTLTAFPLQQWLHKRASVSNYTCTDCLVIEEFFRRLCGLRKRQKEPGFLYQDASLICSHLRFGEACVFISNIQQVK